MIFPALHQHNMGATVTFAGKHYALAVLIVWRHTTNLAVDFRLL